jgi:hypothetical protein
MPVHIPLAVVTAIGGFAATLVVLGAIALVMIFGPAASASPASSE